MPANRIFHRLIGARMSHILWAQSRPADAQRGVYLGLIHGLASTAYGKSLGIYGASDIARRKDFIRRVPIVTYDELKPWILRARDGERSILWPGLTTWFAQSSGTTSTSTIGTGTDTDRQRPRAIRRDASTYYRSCMSKTARRSGSKGGT